MFKAALLNNPLIYCKKYIPVADGVPCKTTIEKYGGETVLKRKA